MTPQPQSPVPATCMVARDLNRSGCKLDGCVVIAVIEKHMPIRPVHTVRSRLTVDLTTMRLHRPGTHTRFSSDFATEQSLHHLSQYFTFQCYQVIQPVFIGSHVSIWNNGEPVTPTIIPAVAESVRITPVNPSNQHRLFGNRCFRRHRLSRVAGRQFDEIRADGGTPRQELRVPDTAVTPAAFRGIDHHSFGTSPAANDWNREDSSGPSVTECQTASGQSNTTTFLACASVPRRGQ